MRGSPSSGVGLSANQSRASNIRQRCHLAVAQGYIQMLPYASPGAPKEGGHDGIGRIEAGRQIGHSNAHLDWRAVPTTGDMHQPHFCLNHDIIACSGAIRACLAVARDASIYQAGIDAVNRLEIHPVLFQCVWQEILHQDITIFDHLMKDFNPCWMSKRKAEGLLVSVYLPWEGLGRLVTIGDVR